MAKSKNETIGKAFELHAVHICFWLNFYALVSNSIQDGVVSICFLD